MVLQQAFVILVEVYFGFNWSFLQVCYFVKSRTEIISLQSTFGVEMKKNLTKIFVAAMFVSTIIPVNNAAAAASKITRPVLVACNTADKAIVTSLVVEYAIAGITGGDAANTFLDHVGAGITVAKSEKLKAALLALDQAIVNNDNGNKWSYNPPIAAAYQYMNNIVKFNRC